jgi:predicted RNase H-like nuclease (RuvC/YqgF family)
MDKNLKEENDIKGKVITIQQKLLEIAVQMFQEKKEECEELKKQQANNFEDYMNLSTRLQMEEVKTKELSAWNDTLQKANNNLKKELNDLKYSISDN